MFRSIITTAAIAALAAGASAQSQLPAGNLHRSVAPSTGIYKMDTGFEATSLAYRSGPDTLFNNQDGLIYYYTGSWTTDEYADGGSFAARGVSGNEQVNGVNFGYCTGMDDTALTGVLDTELRFYAVNDSVNFAGPVGWVDANNRNEACVISITGLPGDQSGAGFACWGIMLDLSGGAECTLPQESAAGMMETWGWSMTYLDPLNTGGPLLDSITGGAVPGYGSFDHFQWYDMTMPLGTENLGAYWFGGPAKAQGSFDLALQGNVSDSTSYTPANPGANDSVNWTVTSEIRPGQAAGWAVTNPDGASDYAMLVSTGSADLPIVAGGSATLLINHTSMPAGPFPMGTGGSMGANLPSSIPAALYTQAVAYTGALSPSNSTAMSNGMKSVN
ncbi:MAG: hypothetical protein H8E25_10070 [Planctomycetes bacterium]|nr:hypothetical protein [Planctomycetota bacterium]